ncbi:unnamed protein product [Gordionus sp. m RMFG-2023]|uniref:uncharacterized protein LOC135927132 n=1 Tax=Gordionus sp. m RMFG-2023 TaxID=3053472 RepID=UPI0030DFD9E9
MSSEPQNISMWQNDTNLKSDYIGPNDTTLNSNSMGQNEKHLKLNSTTELEARNNISMGHNDANLKLHTMGQNDTNLKLNSMGQNGTNLKLKYNVLKARNISIGHDDTNLISNFTGQNGTNLGLRATGQNVTISKFHFPGKAPNISTVQNVTNLKINSTKSLFPVQFCWPEVCNRIICFYGCQTNHWGCPTINCCPFILFCPIYRVYYDEYTSCRLCKKIGT